ncbi:hypothetical protein [Ornithinimicrobium sufpigmenti]|nr:hypothetical protein [Ornithinimicrobium sp. HY006]
MVDHSAIRAQTARGGRAARILSVYAGQAVEAQSHAPSRPLEEA